MVTTWWCDRCTKSGQVEHDADADVLVIAGTILELHAYAAPSCTGGKDTIRVSISITLRMSGEQLYRMTK